LSGISGDLSQRETEAAMQISASLGSGLDRATRDPDTTIVSKETTRASLPAIIPDSARVRVTAPRGARPAATLLAQLVSTVENLPTSRARCRVDPKSGASAYQAVAGLSPLSSGPVIRVL
jgi:hypothetical protein